MCVFSFIEDHLFIVFSHSRRGEGALCDLFNKISALIRLVLFSRSVMSDLATPWTAAYQAPPSMGFSRQEYWSGVPLPSLTLSRDRENIKNTQTELIDTKTIMSEIF